MVLPGWQQGEPSLKRGRIEDGKRSWIVLKGSRDAGTRTRLTGMAARVAVMGV